MGGRALYKHIFYGTNLAVCVCAVGFLYFLLINKSSYPVFMKLNDNCKDNAFAWPSLSVQVW